MTTYKIALLATNKLDYSITVSIDGEIYEYFIKDGDLDALSRQLATLIKANADGKAINLLKSRSSRYVKLSGES